MVTLSHENNLHAVRTWMGWHDVEICDKTLQQLIPMENEVGFCTGLLCQSVNNCVTKKKTQKKNKKKQKNNIIC